MTQGKCKAKSNRNLILPLSQRALACVILDDLKKCDRIYRQHIEHNLTPIQMSSKKKDPSMKKRKKVEAQPPPLVFLFFVYFMSETKQKSFFNFHLCVQQNTLSETRLFH